MLAYNSKIDLPRFKAVKNSCTGPSTDQPNQCKTLHAQGLPTKNQDDDKDCQLLLHKPIHRPTQPNIRPYQPYQAVSGHINLYQVISVCIFSSHIRPYPYQAISSCIMPYLHKIKKHEGLCVSWVGLWMGLWIKLWIGSLLLWRSLLYWLFKNLAHVPQLCVQVRTVHIKPFQTISDYFRLYQLNSHQIKSMKSFALVGLACGWGCESCAGENSSFQAASGHIRLFQVVSAVSTSNKKHEGFSIGWVGLWMGAATLGFLILKRNFKSKLKKNNPHWRNRTLVQVAIRTGNHPLS